MEIDRLWNGRCDFSLPRIVTLILGEIFCYKKISQQRAVDLYVVCAHSAVERNAFCEYIYVYYWLALYSDQCRYHNSVQFVIFVRTTQFICVFSISENSTQK